MSPMLVPSSRKRARSLRQQGSAQLPTPSAPATPNTPAPADTATALYSLLSWVSAGATKFDLYFGTAVSPPLLIPKYVGTSYVPTLLPSTTYYWQVVAFNEGGSATGPVWSFRTPSASTVLFLINGILMTSRIRFPGGLSIHDVLGAAPNTAQALFDTVPPSGGQSVTIGLGLLDADRLLFGGEIQFIDRSYELKPNNVVWPASLVDHTFYLNERRPFGTFVNQSATTIAQTLIAQYAPDFSAAGVQAALPAVSINFDGQDDFMSCMNKLAVLIDGRTKVDYSRVVKLFNTADTDDAPDPLDATHLPLNNPPLRFSTDLSQVRTRVFGKGHGETIPTDLSEREIILPVPDASQFNPVGGTIIAGATPDGAQTDIYTYTGVQIGGSGTFVGPGASPSSAPSVALAGGAGLSSGVFKYAYTDVTGSGESLPSPLASVTTGTIPSAGTNLTAANDVGSGVDVGNICLYGVTFVTSAGGETTIAISSTPVTASDVAPPSSAPTLAENTSGTNITGFWNAGDTVQVALTYSNTAGETTIGPLSNSIIATASGGGVHTLDITNLPISGESSVTSKRIFVYRNGSAYALALSGLAPSATQVLDFAPATGGGPPGTNGAHQQLIRLANIPIGPSGTVSRKIYRYFGATFKLQQTIANNTASISTDQTPNASLGADAPSSNTAVVNQTSVTGVAVGASGTTSRNVYRTAVNGSQLKLLGSITNNTATSFGTDTAADASLGANAPGTDTSGLTQGTGQVLAGSTSVRIASAAPFFNDGGWANLSGGQTVRYTALGGATAPSTAMGLSLTAGAGVESGLHSYCYTFLSAAGESLPSPLASITVGVGGLNRVALTGVAVGPTGTIFRNIYRSRANETALQYLGTYGDNVTTSSTDVSADSALTNLSPPTIDDRSNLSGVSLLGIPASGPGAITTTVNYGSQVLPSPALTGLNNNNGLVRAMAKGSLVHVWVQRDDLDAQAALAQLERKPDGTTRSGIREYPLTDERRSEASLIALCDAELARLSRPIVSVTYATRDPKTRAGKTVSINLSTYTFDPNTFDAATFDTSDPWDVVGDFLIQDVTITFDPAPSLLPRYTVNASSSVFSLADLLRRVQVT